MKAICIKEPGKVEIVEKEMPVRKPGEALLKLLYGGICGSDLGSYRGANAYVSYPISFSTFFVWEAPQQKCCGVSLFLFD